MASDNTLLPDTSIHFGSDNQAGAHPDILDALIRANTGMASGYGNDALTRRAEERINSLFEHECTTFLVSTGTAANALALSALCPPWGGIYCHNGAHVIKDENTAPEFFTGGARQIPIAGPEGKPDLEALSKAISSAQTHGIHNVKPAVISLTNATECGTVFTADELAAYGSLAKQHQMALHVDGARFSNAVVSTGASPAALTWQSGVDVLTFGATKNGAIAAEMVIFFNKQFADDFAYRRKRAGHLWSKHRFLAAQIDAFFHNDLWLNNAQHANAMATRLARGLSTVRGIGIPWPVEANEIFAIMPAALIQQLRQRGFEFYDWPAADNMVRLVTSFNTSTDDIDCFIDSAHQLAGGQIS